MPKKIIKRTAPVEPEPAESQELTIIKAEVPSIALTAKSFEITNAQDMARAGEILSKLNQFNDRVVADREVFTVPLNKLLKNIRERYKPVENMLTEAIASVRTRIGAYQTSETKRANEEAARIAARVGEGKGHLKVDTAVRKMDEIAKPSTVVAGAAGTVKFRTDKVLKITDDKAIQKFIVHSGNWSFMAINLIKLKELLLAGEIIPGAEIEEVQVPINFR